MFHLLWLPVEMFCCGVYWRLRGGAFTSLTGISYGTQFARAGCAALIGISLWPDGRVSMLVAPMIFLGLILTGWEEFDEMGLETGAIANIHLGYWMRWLPRTLGLRIDTVPYDLVGMSQAGAVCMAPAALLAAWWAGWHLLPALIMLCAGLSFGFAYLLARIDFPTIPGFAKGEEWGEVFAGTLVGAALVLAFTSSAAWRV